MSHIRLFTFLMRPSFLQVFISAHFTLLLINGLTFYYNNLFVKFIGINRIMKKGTSITLVTGNDYV